MPATKSFQFLLEEVDRVNGTVASGGPMIWREDQNWDESLRKENRIFVYSGIYLKFWKVLTAKHRRNLNIMNIIFI